MPHKLNQKGFAVVEAVVIVVIVGLIGGGGYAVWRHNHKASQKLAANTSGQTASPAAVDSTKLSSITALELDSSKVPVNWTASTNTSTEVALSATDKSCSVAAVLVSVDPKKGIDISNFAKQQVSAMLQTSRSKGISASELPTSSLTISTSAGKQKLTSYPIGLSIAGYATNENLAFIVAGHSYVGITEACINTNDFTAANQALLAVTVKE